MYRKIFFLILTIFLFVIFSAQDSWAETQPITLPEAVNLALGENLEIKKALREVETSEARLDRTISYFLPKLGIESRYETFESPYQKQAGATADLFLEWNLFNGFRDWYDKKEKNFEFSQAKTNQERQQLFTKANIEAKFYKLLAVIESIKSYDEAIQRNNSQINSAHRRRAAGLASDADILEFELFQIELQAELANLKSEFKQAQVEFREVLGQKNDKLEFIPKGKLIHFHVNDSLESLKNRASQESQSVIAAKYALESAQANKQVALGGYLPQLSIKATYGSRGINETLVAPETTTIGLAKWEFFSGFDTYHARNEASAIAAKAQAILNQTEQTINSQVEIAYTQLKNIEERVDLEVDNKVKAQKFFNVVASEYKRGVKNSTDMKAASQLLLQVLLKDIQYRANFFEEKANLEKAVGSEIKISKGSENGHTD